MSKHSSILLFLFISYVATAQHEFSVFFKNSAIAATNSQLPFWFGANQQGRVLSDGAFLNLSDLYISGKSAERKSGVDWEWGVNPVVGINQPAYLQLNRVFAGLSFRGWELKGGMFYDALKHAGLSTTNGNLARSNNARPYPKLQLATNGYKPVPFFGDWLNVKAEYDEGWLNDDRMVENARLHHKSFYLGINAGKDWRINLGLEHYVMWGGTSRNENTGKLPSALGAYWRYVLGRQGDDSFPPGDQLNVAGNQFGTYQLEVKKPFGQGDVTFYLSHPFEDLSGMNWRNWPDNLLGLHLHFSDNKNLLTDVVYEFTNTRQQSIRDSLFRWNEKSDQWERQLNDPYYTHGIYRSGNTYHQLMMGSPLFFPLIKTDDIVTGIRSLRFYAHHLGLKGSVFTHLQWRGLLTWIHHFGTYQNPFVPSNKQLSGLMEIQYVNPDFPVETGVSVAADSGNAISGNIGLQLWIAKRW